MKDYHQKTVVTIITGCGGLILLESIISLGCIMNWMASSIHKFLTETLTGTTSLYMPFQGNLGVMTLSPNMLFSSWLHFVDSVSICQVFIIAVRAWW